MNKKRKIEMMARLEKLEAKNAYLQGLYENEQSLKKFYSEEDTRLRGAILCVLGGIDGLLHIANGRMKKGDILAVKETLEQALKGGE